MADAIQRGERENDPAAIKNIKDRLDEIEETEKATGGSEALSEEKATLLRQLENPSKQLTTPLRNAHHNIATQFRNLIRGKLNCNMPHLAEHLTSALKMDFPHFNYCPPS